MQVADFRCFCFPAARLVLKVLKLLVQWSRFVVAEELRVVSSSQGPHGYLCLQTSSNLPSGLKGSPQVAHVAIIHPRPRNLWP